MATVPFYNRGKKPVRIGSVLIAPGQCRNVDAGAMGKPVVAAEVAQPVGFDVSEVLKNSVAKIIARLPEFDADQLKKLKAAEEQTPEPRATLIPALDAKIIALAAGTDGDVDDAEDQPDDQPVE